MEEQPPRSRQLPCLLQITKAAGHHMSCFETHALWRNTSVVLTPQRCSRETEALPCFTPQTSLSSLNRFSNSLVPFGICVINPHCPRNSQICFLSRASLSNTHKNKYRLSWGKQVSLMGKSLRREPLPSHPIYAMAAGTLLFQHRSHSPHERNMSILLKHRWQYLEEKTVIQYSL